MVDAEKTRQYYQAMGPGEPCSCNNCKNYYARFKAAYPAAAEYLAGLGVEIEKPLETSPLEPGAKEEHFVLELSPIRLKGWQE